LWRILNGICSKVCEYLHKAIFVEIRHTFGIWIDEFEGNFGIFNPLLEGPV